MAVQYHTARFRLVPTLAKALTVATPAVRTPELDKAVALACEEAVRRCIRADSVVADHHHVWQAAGLHHVLDRAVRRLEGKRFRLDRDEHIIGDIQHCTERIGDPEFVRPRTRPIPASRSIGRRWSLALQRCRR
ncbi:hypothetical protein [Nonomuraea angiospora]|uniref:hypothetical protein n=1 Tax=Nonomuraea angiospora TaxID=46172 RepID=UPI003F4EF40A